MFERSLSRNIHALIVEKTLLEPCLLPSLANCGRVPLQFVCNIMLDTATIAVADTVGVVDGAEELYGLRYINCE